MRLLKTISIQTALMVSIFAVLEYFRYLKVGEFDLNISQSAPLWMPLIFINVASLIWDRPVVKTFANTEENTKAIEAWLTKLSAEEVKSQNGSLHYKVSYIKSFDRDIQVTIEAQQISVEGVLRLLKSLHEPTGYK